VSGFLDVLAKIDSTGGTVVVRDGGVRARVRPGTLSEADREILAQHRDDVIAMLTPVDVDRITPHSGKTGVVSTSAVSTDQDQQPEVEVVEDLDQWLRDNTIEVVPCDKCGSVDRWEDLAGGWHCSACSSPLTAQRLRERAERLRRDAGVRKPAWPIDGAEGVLALTAADLPATPWRSGSLACFDNQRLLNEIRIDLQVIGAGGVNHRSGRLRRDVAAIVAAVQTPYAGQGVAK